MNEEMLRGWLRGRVRLTNARDAGSYIPTWQVGLTQSPPHDLARFGREGYEKNGLIYSCVKERATSFASLSPQVVRRGGVVAEDHRMIHLLANPNTHQDGQDFAEEMSTFLDCSGNVYIELVAESADRQRQREFATFPIQEMEIVRSDYVTIQPGPTRAADIYVVSVGGRVQKRIPRAGMIHIHEPLITNDFYGVAKIARLVREGSLDLEMSDFELAFFRNAGVPMGLLSVKGRVSKEDTDEIRTRWKKAFQGMRHWFDLLVLNADTSTYTPLGLKNVDMGMPETLSKVERRTCSVFGVPPLLVGAFAAMKDSPALSYEEAEHSFWAETMVPDSLRFARAFQKFLLPRFATPADRGAKVTYDFTVVRALQEDRSRKLREVVRLVLTGGFTVNQALAIVGLPVVKAGDFYVRNGNQVIVDLEGNITPMAGSGQGPNLDNPLEGAARTLARPRGVLQEAATVVEEAERRVSIFDGWGSRNGHAPTMGIAPSPPRPAKANGRRTRRTIERDETGMITAIVEEEDPTG